MHNAHMHAHKFAHNAGARGRPGRARGIREIGGNPGNKSDPELLHNYNYTGNTV